LANGFAVADSTRIPDAFQFSLASVTTAGGGGATSVTEVFGGVWLSNRVQNVAPEIVTTAVAMTSRNERDRPARTPMVGCSGFMAIQD
jgi:hypothetical protein